VLLKLADLLGVCKLSCR